MNQEQKRLVGYTLRKVMFGIKVETVENEDLLTKFSNMYK
jgi:hypothetical protein